MTKNTGEGLRWYDYVACFWFADIISAGLFSANIFYLTIGVLSFTMYEEWRKQDG